MEPIYSAIYSLIGIKFNFASLLCAIWLSLYFLISFTVLFSKYTALSAAINNELESLENITIGRYNPNLSKSLLRNARYELYKLNATKEISMKRYTSGLTILSIIASTSPFIGLFGTVVSILITFGEFASLKNIGLNVLAPKISEALVVTAFGILVAIPAYTFHLILKRKVYELFAIVDSEIEILSNIQDVDNK